MPSRGRSRNRGSSRNRQTPSRARRPQADQTSSPTRTSDRLQARRRSIRIAQHHQELLLQHQDDIISGVNANMTDIARRTYPRNDVGPRVVDSRVSRRAQDSPTRRRRESSAISFALSNLGSRLPDKLHTNSHISMKFAITARNASQLRHVNPQTLVVVASLVDDRTRGPASAGCLAAASNSARARPVQPVGPEFEVSFEHLLIKQPGTYYIKVSLLRMPEASVAGGQATHVAEWESESIRVQAMSNGA